MKAILGIVSMLVVLAIVASIARMQVQATVSPGAVATDPTSTVQQQSKDLQERTRSDVARALQDGAQRNESADR